MPASASRFSVLVVDPFPDSLSMYGECLAGSGFEAITTGDADTAWSQVPAADIVVTGIRMSGSFDGVELVRRVRHEFPTKPVIVLTACVTHTHRERAEAAGCDVFLPKPCEPDTLIAEIRRLLVGNTTH